MSHRSISFAEAKTHVKEFNEFKRLLNNKKIQKPICTYSFFIKTNHVYNAENDDFETQHQLVASDGITIYSFRIKKCF